MFACMWVATAGWGVGLEGERGGSLTCDTTYACDTANAKGTRARIE